MIRDDYNLIVCLAPKNTYPIVRGSTKKEFKAESLEDARIHFLYLKRLAKERGNSHMAVILNGDIPLPEAEKDNRPRKRPKKEKVDTTPPRTKNTKRKREDVIDLTQD